MPGLFSFLKPRRPAPATPAAPSNPAGRPWHLEAALRTDVGCVRTTNEDHIRFVNPRPDDPHAQRGALLAVADGMGGHAAGEVASTLAIETLFRTFYASDGPPEATLRHALEAANRAVWDAGQQPGQQGMGTTVTALLLRGAHGYVAHVGDSRLYRLRDGALDQITHDHSLVQEMVRKGLLAPADALHHEDRNVLLQALGNRPTVDVDVLPRPLELRLGDVFLVCSDGLHDGLTAADLQALLAEHDSVQRAADALVANARARGGTDNISAGLVRLSAPSEPAGTAASSRPTREVASPYAS